MTDTRSIVFLDIDGVVNSSDFYFRRLAAGNPRGNRTTDEIDPDAVERLNRLLSASGAVVVLSSSWRRLHSREEMQEILEARGFAGQIVDYTPDLTRKSQTGDIWISTQRGDEIAQWREDNRHVGPYVVLDDDGDMDAVLDHFVQTQHVHGLLDEHVEEALEILKSKEEGG